VPPQLIWSPPVAYPPSMFDRAVVGRVLVEAMVDTTGRVEPGTIEVVSATRTQFEGPAMEMVQNSRFTPARIGARAVPRLVRIPVMFDLKPGSRVAPADSASAAALASEGESLARRGDITEALTSYSKALDLDGRLNASHQFWYELCWYGSLWNSAADVMFACNQAVALEPQAAQTREARGVARAMTSDYAGAIEDLEQSAECATSSVEQDQRLSWIAALRSGQNPFTEEVLRELRLRSN
jgi:TonB family protein